ncbi:MAG: glucokinase, partial [Acaryochloridaceae cyanobacterium CSU_5_19]|nr:glucokinase [Acaryochloridaceae cyanobacterium CSU_5_19]
MTILLVGDIGGTKTTLQLVQTHAATDDQTILQFSTPYEQTYPSQDYPDLTPIVQRFLAEAANARGIESSVAR